MGSMYRMAQSSFQFHVMGPSLRPSFHIFFFSSSSMASAPPWLEVITRLREGAADLLLAVSLAPWMPMASSKGAR